MQADRERTTHGFDHDQQGHKEAGGRARGETGSYAHQVRQRAAQAPKRLPVQASIERRRLFAAARRARFGR